MYVTKPFKFRGNFLDSARKAIKEAFKRYGYAPREVNVHPTTDTGGNTFVETTLNGVSYRIPIIVRNDLKTEFLLDENEAMLDVSNPKSS